ncbi:prenyltransferase [Lactococcus nasutitermitis]|uniref:Prenyltransferase n=1 Tax=Lactococcus nasutitermitis TaxID=1652957 RepID=A0ABV9JEY9_9LACT|nr:prenyltransferase [Lactococcus nasutitermitis]
MTYTLTFKDWFIATRPWSFVVTALPTLFTFLFVLLEEPQYSNRWALGLIAILGSIIYQAGGNLLSDYHDYKRGVDKAGAVVGNDILTSGRFSPKQVLIFGRTMTTLGILLGLFLVSQSGLPLLAIGIFGTLGSVYYRKFKAIALGDLLIFLIYGPIIMGGTYYVMTQHFSGALFFISVHFAFITVNVLHANNLRDIQNDTNAGVHTFASILGVKNSIIYYNLLTYLSYLVIVISVLLAQLPIWSLLSLITLPIAIRNTKMVNQATTDNSAIKDLDKSTAQLQLLVSLTLIIAIIIAIIF